MQADADHSLTRRAILGAATTGVTAGLAGCPDSGGPSYVQRQDDQDTIINLLQDTQATSDGQATRDGQREGEQTATELPTCPDDFEVPPVRDATLKGFVEPRSYTKVGTEFVYPRIEVESSRVGYLGLDYELVGPDGETLAIDTEYYRLEAGRNRVPKQPRTTWVDYYESSVLQDDPQPDEALVDRLRDEGATLTVECWQCGESGRATAEQEVRFLGAFGDSPPPKELDLSETSLWSTDSSWFWDREFVVTDWGMVFTGRIPNDTVVLYANGEQLYEYDYISNLTRLGTSDFAFVRWKDEVPVEVVKYSPDAGETTWPIGSVSHSTKTVRTFSGTSTVPVWFEQEPTKVGIDPAGYLETVEGALLKGGKPVDWAGEISSDLRYHLRPVDGPDGRNTWVINDSVLYHRQTHDVTEDTEWNVKHDIASDIGGYSEWTLYKEILYPKEWFPGEVFPFASERFPKYHSWYADFRAYPVGDTGFALLATIENDTKDISQRSAVFSPTAGWQSPVSDWRGDVFVLDDTIAFVRSDAENDRFQLFWDGWRSDWAQRIDVYGTNAGERSTRLTKPVWTRKTADGTEETMHGKSRLTVNPVRGVAPDGQEGVAYVERIPESKNGPYSGYERVCHSNSSNCGPFYALIRKLVGSRNSSLLVGVAYEGGVQEPVRDTYHTAIVTQIDGVATEQLVREDSRIARAELTAAGNRIGFWRGETEPDGVRLHLLEPGVGDLQTERYSEARPLPNRGSLVVEGATSGDEPFVGAHVIKETESGTQRVQLDNTESQTLPEPPDDKIQAADRREMAFEASRRAFQARMQQIQDEIAVCKQIQKTIRDLPPIKGQGIAQALRLQEERTVNDELKQTAYKCEAAKLRVQIAAPLLANLGQLIVTAVDFTNFVTGLSNSVRQVVNSGGRQVFTELVTEAATQVSLKAANIVTKQVTGYSIPDPRGGDFRDVAQFWTKVALDFSSTEQEQVIRKHIETTAYKSARTDLDWEMQQIKTLQDYADRYNELDAGDTAARKAVVLKIAELHLDIQRRVERLEQGKLDAIGRELEAFENEMRQLRRDRN